MTALSSSSSSSSSGERPSLVPGRGKKRRQDDTTTASASARATNNVVVALSGGVDSSVAAALMQSRYGGNGGGNGDGGWEVSAVHMSNWNATSRDDETSSVSPCSTERDYEDAKRVADHLGIKLDRVSFEREYWTDVFEPYVNDIMTRGEMGNPDVLCNRRIKFGALREHVRKRFGGGGGGGTNPPLLVTGHYARLMHRLQQRGGGVGVDNQQQQQQHASDHDDKVQHIVESSMGMTHTPQMHLLYELEHSLEQDHDQGEQTADWIFSWGSRGESGGGGNTDDGGGDGFGVRDDSSHASNIVMDKTKASGGRVRVVPSASSTRPLPPLLLAASDRSKDQSYFLSSCCAGTQLSNVAFPLGEYYKKSDDVQSQRDLYERRRRMRQAMMKNGGRDDDDGDGDDGDDINRGRRRPDDGEYIDSDDNYDGVGQTQRRRHNMNGGGFSSAPTVRQLAEAFHLPTAQKRESMGICFVGQRRRRDTRGGGGENGGDEGGSVPPPVYATAFQEFVSSYLPPATEPVEFVDIETGSCVGKTPGPAHAVLYTKGQGAKISGGPTRYFCVGPAVSAASAGAAGGDSGDGVDKKYGGPNAVLVCAGTNHPALYADSFDLMSARWMSYNEMPRPLFEGGELRVQCRVRHLAPLVDATIRRTTAAADGGGARGSLSVYLDRPVRGITPGQTAVFYAANGLVCLGGGPVARCGPSYHDLGKILPPLSPSSSSSPHSPHPYDDGEDDHEDDHDGDYDDGADGGGGGRGSLFVDDDLHQLYHHQDRTNYDDYYQHPNHHNHVEEFFDGKQPAGPSRGRRRGGRRKPRRTISLVDCLESIA